MDDCVKSKGIEKLVIVMCEMMVCGNCKCGWLKL